MPFVRPLLSIATWASVVTATIFQLSVFDGESSLNGQTVNAAGGVFYAGLSTPGTFCPQGVQCPGGTSTLFAGLDSLWVEAPGGQQVYVDESGALSFTIAHSLEPPTTAQGAFTNVTVVSDCAAPFNVFTWQSSQAGTGGIFACPQTDQGSDNASYQIYAKTPAFTWTNCTEIIGLLAHVASGQGFGAYEYA